MYLCTSVKKWDALAPPYIPKPTCL